MKIIRLKISILSTSQHWHLIAAFRVAKAIFKVKLTVHVQQHSFLTHGWMFLWKCQSFWDRKCLDLRGTRTPNLRIHTECFNHLSFCSPMFFWYWLWQYKYFRSQVNIWNLDWARASAFVFDTKTDVFVKVPKFLMHKMSRPEGNSNI